MPRMNGLEVLQKIKDEKIDVKILVLTVHNEVEYLLKAVDIGINGYLLKDSESICIEPDNKYTRSFIIDIPNPELSSLGRSSRI